MIAFSACLAWFIVILHHVQEPEDLGWTTIDHDVFEICDDKFYIIFDHHRRYPSTMSTL